MLILVTCVSNFELNEKNSYFCHSSYKTEIEFLYHIWLSLLNQTLQFYNLFFFLYNIPEVKCSTPCRQWINCSVHNKYPTFLWSSLIYRKYAGGNIFKTIKTNDITAKKIHFHAFHARWALITRIGISGTKCIWYGQGINGKSSAKY